MVHRAIHRADSLATWPRASGRSGRCSHCWHRVGPGQPFRTRWRAPDGSRLLGSQQSSPPIRPHRNSFMAAPVDGRWTKGDSGNSAQPAYIYAWTACVIMDRISAPSCLADMCVIPCRLDSALQACLVQARAAMLPKARCATIAHWRPQAAT